MDTPPPLAGRGLIQAGEGDVVVTVSKFRLMLVLRFHPEPDGAHGGCHRSYQVWWDCVEALGTENVDVIVYAPRRPSSYREWSVRPRMWRQNPLTTVAASPVAWALARSTASSEPLAQYQASLRTHGAPALCIVEDAVWFHGIVLANRRLGVPTWACPQNIESLDYEGTLKLEDRLRTLSRLGDLINELRTLAACRARFAISQIESGFLSGVGLDTELYPYRPVGELRDFFLKIRAARARGGMERGLVVVLGSATHAPTAEGMEWFLAQVRAHGLPAQGRIELVGFGTDRVKGLEAIAPPGVARGWVESEALAGLLARAHLVAVPHFSGFGALTRLAELPLAGIPVLAGAHAARAVDKLTGVEPLPRQWSRWQMALEDHLGREPGVCPEPFFDNESVLRQALTAERGARHNSGDTP
jgi:hypothetical protein